MMTTRQTRWHTYHYEHPNGRKFTWITTDDDPGPHPGEGWVLSGRGGPFATYGKAAEAKMNHLRSK
jgi:hypothetical protein